MQNPDNNDFYTNTNKTVLSGSVPSDMLKHVQEINFLVSKIELFKGMPELENSNGHLYHVHLRDILDNIDLQISQME